MNQLYSTRILAWILSATVDDVTPEYFKQRLSIHDGLVHITIKINWRVQQTVSG